MSKSEQELQNESMETQEVTIEEDISENIDASVSDIASETQELEEKIKDLEDLAKRQAADFDNFRKRFNDEKERIKETSQESIILDFLPIFDNIERAFESCKAPEVTIKSITDGLEGIMAMFQDFLSKQGLEKVESIGTPFDVKLHEALFMQEGDYPEKQVIQEVEKAYIRKGRVIRTAKVGIGVPKENKGE